MSRTLYEAFTSGFLAGMSVVHSQDVFEQQEEYFQAWKKRKPNWCTSTLVRFQQMEIEDK